MPTPTPEEINAGAEKIIASMSSGKPFFIGRNGSTELESIGHYMDCKRHNTPFSPNIIRRLQRVSGIWPANADTFEKWVKDYLISLTNINGVSSGWYEPMADYETFLLSIICPSAFQMPLRSLEPYYVEPELRWTRLLSGKRVAVVSSFSDTIELQLQKRGIWASDEMLPVDTTWIPIRTFFPPEISEGDATGWPPEITGWQEAVDRVVAQVVESGAQVALIGCGALAMSIGSRLYTKGISAVLMGGAIQVLFGIKGARWEKHSVISKFWNDAWVWPTAAETPSGAQKIEGACYW